MYNFDRPVKYHTKGEFNRLCKEHGVAPTRRQYKKYNKGVGILRQRIAAKKRS